MENNVKDLDQDLGPLGKLATKRAWIFIIGLALLIFAIVIAKRLLP